MRPTNDINHNQSHLEQLSEGYSKKHKNEDHSSKG